MQKRGFFILKKIGISFLAFILMIGAFTYGCLYVVPIKYGKVIKKYSEKYNVDPFLATSIAKKESGFKDDNIYDLSKKDMRKIAKEMNVVLTKKDEGNPRKMIKLAVWYIGKSYNESEMDVQKVVYDWLYLKGKKTDRKSVKTYQDELAKERFKYRIFRQMELN